MNASNTNKPVSAADGEAQAETALVVTAIPLSKTQSHQISEVLKEKFGREVKLENRVDKSVIAGMYIRVGDQIIDSTLRLKLDKLRERLLP